MDSASRPAPLSQLMAEIHKTFTRTSTETDDDGGTSSVRIGGRYLEILFLFFAMVIPMIAFSGSLLGLVYYYRVVHNNFVSENLRFPGGEDEPDVIYVRLSATTLTAVASWSSTMGLIVAGFAVTLISYPVARTLLNAVKNN